MDETITKKMSYSVMCLVFGATLGLGVSCGELPKDLTLTPPVSETPTEDPARDPASDPKEDVGSGSSGSAKIPEPIFGVTIDSISSLNATVKALQALPVKTTVRIVFDEYVEAKDYKKAAQKIHEVSYIMGEILDSLYVPQYNLTQYHKRVIEYLDELNGLVDIWEIGNEINGEWLGKTEDVIAKISTAYDLVRKKGGKTALTLYYNENCWERSENEMFRWASKHIPARLKKGLDYVLVSYYEEDCNDFKPKWQSVFDKLGALFPNSKIGFGEIGSSVPSKKTELLQRYYSLKINHPRYIGGYFWWYFKQDMVPQHKGLWNVFFNLLQILKK